MIAGNNHDGGVGETQIFQSLQNAAYMMISHCDHGMVSGNSLFLLPFAVGSVISHNP